MSAAEDILLRLGVVLKAKNAEAPVTEEELTAKLKALGWHPGLITDVIRMSTGTYIVKSDDGKFRAIRR